MYKRQGQSGAYQQYGGAYNWGGNAYGWGGAQYQQNERSEYTAAKNYIRNGMYREAINALSGVPVRERDGKWYYLSAGANMYMGNKIAALEAAKKAVEIEPGNEEYRRLLEIIQRGGDFYDDYTVHYSSGPVSYTHLSAPERRRALYFRNFLISPSVYFVRAGKSMWGI